MDTFELETLPQICTAHVYSAESYTNQFLPQNNTGFEVTFISKGTLTLLHKNQEITAHEGDVICFFPETKLTVRADSFHEHHTVIAMAKWKKNEGSISGLYLPLLTPSHFNTKPMTAIIDQFIHGQYLFKESPSRGAAKLLELLSEIDSCNRKERDLCIPGEIRYTQRAKEYIHSHIQFPITQSDVAKYLSITPEYLCAVFKKTEGISLIRYTNGEKLRAIKALMEKENVRLYEAAALFGYSDPNYVSRLFKKHFGYNITEKPNRYSK